MAISTKKMRQDVLSGLTRGGCLSLEFFAGRLSGSNGHFGFGLDKSIRVAGSVAVLELVSGRQVMIRPEVGQSRENRTGILCRNAL